MVVPMMHCSEEPEHEREERESYQQQQLLKLLQPKLLSIKSSNNRGGRGIICVCGKSKGTKSVEGA
jgi:hypothetical protein